MGECISLLYWSFRVVDDIGMTARKLESGNLSSALTPDFRDWGGDSKRRLGVESYEYCISNPISFHHGRPSSLLMLV